MLDKYETLSVSLTQEKDEEDFKQWINKYVLSTYNMPGIMLCYVDKTMNKRCTSAFLTEFEIKLGYSGIYRLHLASHNLNNVTSQLGYTQTLRETPWNEILLLEVGQHRFKYMDSGTRLNSNLVL